MGSLEDHEKWRSSWVIETNYKPEYDKKLLDHLSAGMSLGSFNVGVSYTTISNWLKKYPSFRAAREEGDKNRLALLESEGMKMVRAGNVSAWKFLMMQHGMSEKVELKTEVGAGTMFGVADPIRKQRLQRLAELHRKVTSGEIIIDADYEDLEDL